MSLSPCALKTCFPDNVISQLLPFLLPLAVTSNLPSRLLPPKPSGGAAQSNIGDSAPEGAQIKPYQDLVAIFPHVTEIRTALLWQERSFGWPTAVPSPGAGGLWLHLGKLIKSTHLLMSLQILRSKLEFIILYWKTKL